MIKRLTLVFVLSLLTANVALAHVSVRPDKVGVAAFQTFNVSVPSEKDLATTSLRLVLPTGLESVTPTVKPGWNIEVKTHLQDGVTHFLEILWSGGSVPGHYRDDFTFSAKAPATAGTLAWKAYQGYADGSVVSWELAPNAEQPKDAEGKPDFSRVGPYSQTAVVDDLSTTNTLAPVATAAADRTPLIVGSLAFVISLAALVLSLRKNKATP
jgi:uncharacterized protein YcnI